MIKEVNSWYIHASTILPLRGLLRLVGLGGVFGEGIGFPDLGHDLVKVLEIQKSQSLVALIEL